jgi:hypothetical protein
MTIIFQKVKSITHCEHTELSEIVAHNFRQLGVKYRLQGGQFKYLGINQSKWDWIYIDPSRRNDAKGKVLCSKIVYPMFLII